MSTPSESPAPPIRATPLATVVGRGLLFAAALAVIAGLLEWQARGAISSYRKKHDGLQRAAPTLQVLVTGSSNAFYDIDPSQFRAPGFNVADVSQALYQDDRILARWLPSLPELRLVIIPLGLMSLEFSLAESSDAGREFFYLHEWGIEPERSSLSGDPRRHSVLLSFPPAVRLQVMTHRAPLDIAPEVTDRGWFRAVGQGVALTPEQGRERAEYHRKTMVAAYAPTGERLLGDMLDRLAPRRIQAALVILPVHRFYAEHFDAGARARQREVLQRIASARHAVLRDYSDDPRFDTGDYFDTDHFNQRGAERFSRILDQEVVAPALSQ